MKRHLSLKLLFTFVMVGILVACQNRQTLTEGNTALPEIEPTLDESMSMPDIEPTVDESMPIPESAFAPLPQRTGPRTQTSGTVPHVQIGVDIVSAVNEELYRLAFALPDVENRPTIVSLPGARGMWLRDELTLIHPEVIVSGREFAHIHPDGSLHVPLPYERALEAVEKGWAERHPWADQRDGWEGFVMLFTPQSMAELDVIFQLILDSYNFVTGKSIIIADLDF
jgi:phospholipase/carboxylesterase